MTGHFLLTVLCILLPLAAVGFWWTSARARELAVQHAGHACRQQQVQFLDQSVALARIRPTRSAGGRLAWRRVFHFEFTNHADFRDTATLVMHDHALVCIRFPYTRDPEGYRIYAHEE